MTWAPNSDSGRTTELRERGTRVFGYLATDAGGGFAINFPGLSPIFIQCWRDPVGNSRLLVASPVDNDVDWADERISKMLLEPSSSRVARPIRSDDRLLLMLFLPDTIDDESLALFVHGVAFDAASLRDRLIELNEAS